MHTNGCRELKAFITFSDAQKTHLNSEFQVPFRELNRIIPLSSTHKITLDAADPFVSVQFKTCRNGFVNIPVGSIFALSRFSLAFHELNCCLVICDHWELFCFLLSILDTHWFWSVWTADGSRRAVSPNPDRQIDLGSLMKPIAFVLALMKELLGLRTH